MDSLATILRKIVNFSGAKFSLAYLQRHCKMDFVNVEYKDYSKKFGSKNTIF